MQEVGRHYALEKLPFGRSHGVEDAGPAGFFVHGPVAFLAGLRAVGAVCAAAAG